MADSASKKRKKQSEPCPRRKAAATALFLDPESLPSTSTAEIEVVRDQKITPILAGVLAANPADRAKHLAAASSIVEDGRCRRLLLKDHIIQVVMEQSLLDPAQEVVAAAWTFLDKLVEHGGYDVAVHLYRRGIMKLVDGIVDSLDSTIDKVEAGPQAVLLWECASSVISLLTGLNETTVEILQEITTPKILAFASRLLAPTTPERVQTAASVFLDRVTDSNTSVYAILSRDSNCITQLLRLNSTKNEPTLLQTAAACGALNNLIIQAPADDDFTHEHHISPAQLAEPLTAVIKAVLSQPSSRETQQALYTSIDTLTDLANHVTETFGRQPTAANGINGAVDEMDEAAESDDEMDDEDASDPDDEDEEIADGDDSDDESELPDDLGADLDMVAGDEGTAARASGPKPLPSPELTYLVTYTVPAILPIVTSNPSDEPSRRIAHASITLLSAIARAFATITATNPPRKLKFTLPPPLLEYYRAAASSIWDTVITPVLLSNSADIALADNITTLAIHITAFAPSVSISHNQHRSFLALYNAAAAPIPLKAACIRVLANLAQCQGTDRIPVNREIGTFLITTVNKLPYLGDPEPEDIHPEVIVACLDAIYDVYADKEFDYDAAVFVQLGFLKYLRSFVGRVKGMAKKIDKRKNPELRESVEEVLLNLNAFIKYKSHEQE
ncbi:hypothetical protein Dda_2821 [Drechslerella dactyloides]|uniref:SYO1-like TPR repeats domain-containing protein n=1 Tax=Drechslerella dactyloides TaxID=74499 RepID=A0AAD6J072_DREDA|nr:hypothetical protein Dda_2821 [Drechslerella dactyloides]